MDITKFKNQDKFIDFFRKYVWYNNEKLSENYSISDVSREMSKLGWLYDVIIGTFWILIKKKILTKKDLKEIFWHTDE